MDAQRISESIDLDAELAELLSVEPSVEFVARVRMRIATEPSPRRWRPSWLLAAATACAVLITIGVAATRTNHPTTNLLADISLLVPALVPAPVAAAASGWRREKPTPEMQAVMRSNEEAVRTVTSHLANRNYEAIASEAVTLTGNFASLERFWSAREIEDAARLSRRAFAAATELRAAALMGDATAMAEAIAAMTAVCNACHARYREELPDRTYAIKL
jgi:cytochrome c'